MRDRLPRISILDKTRDRLKRVAKKKNLTLQEVTEEVVKAGLKTLSW